MITSSNSRFALTQIFLDKTRMDEITTTYMVKAGGYRYQFNGIEVDNEVSGAGNSYTAEFWQYSPRIVKRWNVDPMTAKYPWQSPYSVFNNNPIYFNDPLGLEGQDWIGKKDEKGRVSWKWDENVTSPDQLPDGYTEYAAPGHTYPSDGRMVKLGNGKN